MRDAIDLLKEKYHLMVSDIEIEEMRFLDLVAEYETAVVDAAFDAYLNNDHQDNDEVDSLLYDLRRKRNEIEETRETASGLERFIALLERDDAARERLQNQLDFDLAEDS